MSSASEADLEEQVLDVLAKIKERLEEMCGFTHSRKVRHVSLQSSPVSPARHDQQCVCCLLPIEKGDFWLSMPCCGAHCHVLCMARVSNSHPLMMSHACSNCVKPFTAENKARFIKMGQILGAFNRPE